MLICQQRKPAHTAKQKELVQVKLCSGVTMFTRSQSQTNAPILERLGSSSLKVLIKPLGFPFPLPSRRASGKVTTKLSSCCPAVWHSEVITIKWDVLPDVDYIWSSSLLELNAGKLNRAARRGL